MRSSTVRRTALGLVMLAGVIAPGAARADDPEIVDRAGDANLVTPQGLPADPNTGPETAPASVAGADIRSIAFDTTYTTAKVRNPDGSVARVVHTPTGLKITVTMEGDILPTPGPSLGVLIPTSVNGCESHFQAFWRGPGALPNDPQRAAVRKIPAGCGGDVTLTAGLSLAIEGKTATLTYPFSAFTGAHEGFLADEIEIGPAPIYLNSQNAPYTTTAQYAQAGNTWAHVYATPIDMTPRFDTYVIGSDVPEDVDCLATPDHPDCLS